MKHIAKRILSFLFAVCMLLSSVGDLTLLVFAEEDTAPILELETKVDETYEVKASFAVDVPAEWTGRETAYMETLRGSIALNVREILAADPTEEGTDTTDPPAEPTFDNYVLRAKEALKLQDNALVAARVLGISLQYSATGADYHPSGAVTVSVRLLNGQLLNNHKCLDVVHIPDTAEEDVAVLSSTVSETKDAVEFQTEDFSVFVLTDYTNYLTVTADSAEKTYDGKKLTNDGFTCDGV